MGALDDVKEARSHYQKTVKASGKASILEVLSDLFEKHENVKAVRWGQGTPSFNDGDPCRFGVHEIEVKLDDQPERTAESEEEGNDGFLSEYGLDNPPLVKAMERVNKTFGEFEDVLEEAFGDDTRVIVSRGGKVTYDSFDLD